MSVEAFRELAAERLRDFPYTTVDDAPGMRRAAVVLCVIEHAGAPCVIVIKRAYRGRNAGQWGLPGGRLDDGETPLQAALRELHEEIGLEAGPSDDAPRWIPQPDGARLLQLRLRDDMVIHAPTGAILLQFRELVLLGRPTRVADLLQPDWTQR